MRKQRQEFMQFTVRLPLADGQRVVDAAHAARLSKGEFLRTLLTTGQASRVAPPVPDQMSGGRASLIQGCLSLCSNVTQLIDHSLRLGGTLVQLTGPHGALEQMKTRARELGFKAKAGELDEPTIQNVLARLTPAGHDLNSLARALNENEAVPLDAWRRCLSATSEALKS